jgi:hypothetical protein
MTIRPMGFAQETPSDTDILCIERGFCADVHIQANSSTGSGAGDGIAAGAGSTGNSFQNIGSMPSS